MNCPRCGFTSPTPPGLATCPGCGGALNGVAVMTTTSPINATSVTACVTIENIPSSYEPGASPYAPRPILGPLDRESFFDAQAKHRRQTWRVTAACVVAAVLTGIPLSMSLTPVLYAVVVLVTWLADLVLPVPTAVWDAYEAVGTIVLSIAEWVSAEPRGPAPWGTLLPGAAVWLLPGILVMLALWPGLRHVFEDAGVGGMLRALDAREPLPGDHEERQLVNVVEEMAVAAGIPTPRVMLLDTTVANAATIGSSREDATILVSRVLLDDLDREETQGVLGHLVASIGNGDLGIALSIVTVFQTFGLASTILRAPVNGQARAALWRVGTFLLSPAARKVDRAGETDIVAGMLSSAVWQIESDDFDAVTDDDPAMQIPGLRIESLYGLPFLTIVAWIAVLLLDVPGPLVQLGYVSVLVFVGYVVWHQRVYVRYMLGRFSAYVRLIAMLPYYLGVIIPQILLMLLTSFVLVPCITLLWRTRRYLADATAVQLTRNPDGVAAGLNALVERGGLVPGGQWAAPLFVVGPEQTTRRATEQPREGIRTPAEERGGAGPHRMLNEAVAVVEEGVPSVETEAGGVMGGGNASVGSFHPTLERRLKRLRTLGASIADHEEVVGRSPINGALGGVLAVLLVPLLILLVVLMAVLLALLTALSLAFSGVLMLIVYGVMSLIVG